MALIAAIETEPLELPRLLRWPHPCAAPATAEEHVKRLDEQYAVARGS